MMNRRMKDLLSPNLQILVRYNNEFAINCNAWIVKRVLICLSFILLILEFIILRLAGSLLIKKVYKFLKRNLGYKKNVNLRLKYLKTHIVLRKNDIFLCSDNCTDGFHQNNSKSSVFRHTHPLVVIFIFCICMVFSKLEVTLQTLSICL